MKAVRVLRRIGVGLLVTVLSLVGVGTVGGVLAVRASFPDYDGSRKLPGLSAPADVYRDEYGVPQVYANTAEDLFRAEGYLHAQDRFWEMDFRRHVTAGRLAELFGESQVETDSYIRTMGWRRVAEAEYKLLTPDTRRWLEAYAAGVNSWLADHSGVGASLEYGLLKLQNPGYKIEKWNPVDSVAWLKAMAWDLRGNMSDEFERADLLAAGLSREQIEELYPAYPEQRHAPILSTGGVRAGVFDPAAPNSQAIGTPSPVEPAGGAGCRRGLRRSAALRPRCGRSGVGWKGCRRCSGRTVTASARTPGCSPVAGPPPASRCSRTIRTSGRPRRPPGTRSGCTATWSRRSARSTSAASASPACPAWSSVTTPGWPGASPTWGRTSPTSILEKVTGDEYELDGKKLKLERRTEKIKVAGGETVTITVRSTGNGPLLSDVADDLRRIGEKAPVNGDGTPASASDRPSTGYGVALRWTALEPGRTADAIFAVSTIRDWQTFREAAKLFAVPAQNLVYADVDGNIGYQAPGDVPLRAAGDGQVAGAGLAVELPVARPDPVRRAAQRAEPAGRVRGHGEPGGGPGGVPVPAHHRLGLRLPQPAHQRR